MFVVYCKLLFVFKIWIRKLIDKKMNQNLFNIIMVLGESFYIFNDIDKGVKDLERIKLKNDYSTGFKWKMTLLEKEL